MTPRTPILLGLVWLGACGGSVNDATTPVTDSGAVDAGGGATSDGSVRTPDSGIGGTGGASGAGGGGAADASTSNDAHPDATIFDVTIFHPFDASIDFPASCDGEKVAAIPEDAGPPCSYEIPVPQGGLSLDFNRVNVLYEPGTGHPDAGQLLYLFEVRSPSECDASGGWYYDDPASPMLIRLCDASCTTISADSTGSLSIELGCFTFVR